MTTNTNKIFFLQKTLFIIIVLFSSAYIFSNPYIDDINKIKEKPITYGSIDENMRTELYRSYQNLLPFELKEFSIFADLKGFVYYNKDLENFINNVLSFSTMKNLYYLDPKSNKMTLMVKNAYFVDDKMFEKTVDKKYKDLIKDNTFYIIEDDVKVGKILLKGEIKFINEDEFTLFFSNINDIKFIFNLVEKNNYNIFYHFIKSKNGYFIYNAVKVKSKNKILVWLIKKPEDFQNRLIAFYNWLVKQLNDK